MYLVLKNKFGSITGASKVTNEKGEQVYSVEGSFGSNVFTKKYKKTIVNSKGEKLYTVCNKRIHGLKRACFIYNADEVEVCRIQQQIKLGGGFTVEGLKQKIEINRVSITSFDILVDGKKTGSIGPDRNEKGKIKMSVTDTFRIEFNDPEDASFMVAMAVAIDNISDANSRH